jgi:hypothetical protein
LVEKPSVSSSTSQSVAWTARADSFFSHKEEFVATNDPNYAKVFIRVGNKTNERVFKPLLEKKGVPIVSVGIARDRKDNWSRGFGFVWVKGTDTLNKLLNLKLAYQGLAWEFSLAIYPTQENPGDKSTKAITGSTTPTVSNASNP